MCVGVEDNNRFAKQKHTDLNQHPSAAASASAVASHSVARLLECLAPSNTPVLKPCEQPCRVHASPVQSGVLGHCCLCTELVPSDALRGGGTVYCLR